MHTSRIVVASLAAVAACATILHTVALTPAELARHDAQPLRVDWDRVEVDDGEQLEISWLGQPRVGLEGEWIERLLEERFHVELRPVFMDGNAYSRKKPLMFAGGSVPDVFWEMDPILLQRDAYHRFLLPVPYEVLLRYAPTYIELLNSVTPIGWLYAFWKGDNFGLPTCYLEGRYSRPGIWRRDWLRQVGIETIPETLDQMHEALHRFTYDDPDQDGVANTYGMSGDVTSFWWGSFNDVFGAYGVTPFDWMERDGQVVYGGILPETQHALALLHEWYAEGIIDPEFVTDRNNRGSLNLKFMNGRIGYMCYASSYKGIFDPEDPNSMVNILAQLDPDAEIASGWLPRGPGGHRGSRVWGGGGHVISFGRHLAQHPEKVIRVLKMLEEIMVDEELYIASSRGQRGLHWEYRDPAVGPNSGTVFLPPYDDRNVQRRSVLGEYFNPMIHPVLEDRYTPRQELAFRDTYNRPEYAMADLLGKPDAVPSAGQYMGDLRSLQLTVFAEMIRGDRPVEDFDQFVTQWLERGGAQMLSEASELHRVSQEIYRKVGALR
jgi:putative aldouronate transport system substrate-binding protein